MSRQIHIMTPPNLKNRWFTSAFNSCWICINSPKIRKISAPTSFFEGDEVPHWPFVGPDGLQLRRRQSAKCLGDGQGSEQHPFLHLDVGQNGRPLMGPQIEMSSLVLTIQLLGYLILTHTHLGMAQKIADVRNGRGNHSHFCGIFVNLSSQWMHPPYASVCFVIASRLPSKSIKIPIF